MTISTSKKARVNYNHQNIPPQHLQVFQQAAALLKISVTQLLEQGPEQGPEQGSGTYSQDHEQNVSLSSTSQSGMMPNLYDIEPQFSVSQPLPTGLDYSSGPDPILFPTPAYGMQLENAGQGTMEYINHLDYFGSNKLPGNMMMLTDPSNMIVQQPMGRYSSNNELSMRSQDLHEIDKVFAEEPDSSASDLDPIPSTLDDQPWENVSLTDPLAVPKVSETADYLLWIEHEDNRGNQQNLNKDIPDLSTSQWDQQERSLMAPTALRQKHRGKFVDEQLRAETSQTRRLKACIRCRMQKIRVGYPKYRANVMAAKLNNTVQC
jgi:hypothetical protein